MLDTIGFSQTWEQLKLETVNVKVDLSIITHDAVSEHPFVNVSLNGFPKFGEICEKDTVVEFDVEIEDDSENQISIKYINRDIGHDVIRDAQGTIIKNKQIEISSISVDDIELDYYNILFSLGCTNYTDIHYYENFKLDPDKFPLVQYENTILGAEGTWSLSFTSPVYIWLLENI